MLSITVDRGAGDPVYEQLAEQIRRHIASGSLRPGTTLPAVRQLASDLGVNLNTVARGYRLLESEGFLEIRDRSGVRVAAPAERMEQSTRTRLLDELRATLARIRQAGMGTEELLSAVHEEVTALDDKELTDD